MEPTFIHYQRKMWTWLTYFVVCRFYIDLDKHGNYVIKETGKIRRFLYYAIWVNSWIKIGYLLLTYHGWLLHVGFLDQMSMWDWFLCFSQLIQESNMWYRKYPLYEVIHANWKIQEEIYRKLGKPRELSQKITHTCKGLVLMHCIIIFIGCNALAVQVYAAPKFVLNTYAIFPYDHWLWRFFFAAHEYIYIFHIWVHQASSIVLCEVFSVTYTHILTNMADVMKQLSEIGEIKPIGFEDGIAEGIVIPKKKSLGRLSSIKRAPDTNQFIPDRIVDTKSVVPGTEYHIFNLLHDYKKIMIAAREFNAWVGKLMAGTNMSNYGQFISDVFMMIQLLKEPETDITGVMFFFEDACAGMCMLFRMLILMSRVYPASEDFLNAYKTYLHQDTHLRKYLLKYEKTLRIVAAKIGGYSTNPNTVPVGVNALMNYYIGAAMWQRPADRLT